MRDRSHGYLCHGPGLMGIERGMNVRLARQVPQLDKNGLNDGLLLLAFFQLGLVLRLESAQLLLSGSLL